MTRRTFYRHFPDDLSLFAACTQHGLARWPPPDPEQLRSIADPRERLRTGLCRLYIYFAEAGPRLLVTRRDAPLLSAAARALPSAALVLATIPAALAEGWEVPAERRRAFRAALQLATSVVTWNELVQASGLGDKEAVDLLVGLVIAAAGSA